MRTLFLDLSFGVAGDMLISSLLCHLEKDSLFVDAMNGFFNEEQTEMLVTDKTDYSLKGKSFEIICKSDLQPRYLNDIIKIIEGKSLSKNVKENSINAFKHLAKVEGQIHGKSPEEIHFHEIGAMDTIVDIVGFYYLLELLNIDKVLATPVNVGKGMIKIAHGTLPVPAPATAELLKGRTVFSGSEDGERATPTGSVLIALATNEKDELPPGKLISTGYGFGFKKFADGNYVRSIIIDEKTGLNCDTVYLLECNIDDMTGEQLGFAFEQLLEAKALDVWQQSIYMKKGRVGTKLSVLCKDKDKFISLIFKHTSTLGIRINRVDRAIRGESEFKIKNGIRYKVTGDIKKPEYEDMRSEALRLNTSIGYIYNKTEEDNEG